MSWIPLGFFCLGGVPIGFTSATRYGTPGAVPLSNLFIRFTFIKQGPAAEKLLDQLFFCADFPNAISSLSKEMLIETSKRLAPKRYQTVNEIHNLKRCSANEILDFLYGIDHLIDVGENTLISIDTTADPKAVASKVGKAQNLSRLCAAIGVQQHFVVFVAGLIMNPDAEVMAVSVNNFWDEMVDALNGPSHRVRSHRLYVS